MTMSDQEDRLSWDSGPGSPHSQLPGGCGLGSGDLVLLFKKEGQWEETSIPRLRNWGEGRKMVPRVLNKAHTGEGSESRQKAGRCGKSIPLRERAEVLHGHSGH